MNTLVRTQANMAAMLIFAVAFVSILTTTSATIVDTPMVNEEGPRCPKMCRCDRKSFKVTCTGNNVISRIPQDLPADTVYLDISKNAITTLHNDSLSHLPDLRYLNLANNGLVTITADAFDWQSRLEILDLQGNSLTEQEMGFLKTLSPTLVKLDLGENMLNTVPKELTTKNDSSLKELDLSCNNISYVPEDIIQNLTTLVHLNVSYNNITTLTLVPTVIDKDDNITEPVFYKLRTLDISHNRLDGIKLPCAVPTSISRKFNLTAPLMNLRHFDMSHNPIITNVPSDSFILCPHLTSLDISYMEDLLYIDAEAFNGLNDLKELALSHNKQLNYLHALTFENLTSLVHVDLSHNGLTSVNDATFRNLTALNRVKLTGNPWHCDCDSHWMGPVLTLNDSSRRVPPISPDDFLCASPPELAGLYLVDILPSHNFSCHSAYIVNYTRTTQFTVGSSAVLNCVAAGDPSPYIAWITPRKDVIRYHPAFVHPGRPGPQSASYHTGHSWHGSSEYAASLPASARRMHVLANGSLYIDYVQRTDAGRYTCLVHNHLGNDSVVIRFHLNYLVISQTMVRSMIIGFLAAAIFLAFGLITAMIRYVIFTCSREQRQKRKSIKEILEGLETFRTDKLDRLSAYKTAKIDQLAAFKTAKVDKLRGYKNITVTTLVHYLQRSREHYTNQTVHIKDNCAQQVEKLRESYSLQRLKFKDYRSHQVEKIKENYNGQLLKIRLYGSGQLERLRDQYKLQQQHILKLLELLDIGSCMTLVEAECLRTDSMIFDTDLSFDLEAAVYAPASRSNSMSGSEYMTAGDNTDNSSNVSNSGSVVFDVNLDDPINTSRKPNGSDSNGKEVDTVSNSTMTQLNVDLASAGLKQESNKEDKPTMETSSATTSTKTDSVTDSTTQVKPRHSRKKHRHKHSAPARQDTPDLEERCPQEKRPRRRVSPRDRHDKHKDRQHRTKSQERFDHTLQPESLRVNRDIIAHAREIDKTLEEIATDIDNLKREPLNLSIPDLNLDLAHGVITEPEDNVTPSTTTVTIENELSQMKSVSPGTSNGDTVQSTSTDQSATRRKQWQQQKSEDQPSTDITSTDYESAQEPESRGNTPKTGFYEHTGSPQSFASFPSTPSTPTLTSDFHHPVVILDPAQLDRQQTASRESSV